MNTEIAESTVNLRMIESIVELIRSLSAIEKSILEQKLYNDILTHPSKINQEPKPILEFFEEIHRQEPFRTSEQIDRDLRAERDSWDD